jgi:polar amino acid transport system substrate-binding protein
VGISFIGAGNFARGVLIPRLKRLKGVRLRGVVAATGVTAKNAASQFGFAFSATDYAMVLDDSETDCVVIATRHDSHAEIAAEALKRGKPAFVEKPLALDLAGLKSVVSSITGDSLLMVGYNRRFAPLSRIARDRICEAAGPVTIVYRVNAGLLPAGHWSLDEVEGGGRIIGEVCHFVDLIQYLTNERPARVAAAAAPRLSGSNDDSVAISIAMSGGSVASIVYSAKGDPALGKERIELFADGLVFVIDDFKSGELFSRGRRKGIGRSSQEKGHGEEMAAFIEAVHGNAPAPISIESIVATSLATFAIVESARTGNSVEVEDASLLVRN